MHPNAAGTTKTPFSACNKSSSCVQITGTSNKSTGIVRPQIASVVSSPGRVPGEPGPSRAPTSVRSPGTLREREGGREGGGEGEREGERERGRRERGREGGREGGRG